MKRRLDTVGALLFMNKKNITFGKNTNFLPMENNEKYLSPSLLVYELSPESTFLNNSLQDPKEDSGWDW